MRLTFRLAAVLLALCFFLCPVGAKAQNAQLTDQAGLLAEEEGKGIAQQIKELEKSSGWEVMAVTTEDAEGMGAQEYAETWFDEYTEKEDGIICLIDMDNREIAIRAFGESRYYITDDRADAILDAGYKKITKEDYGGTLEAMLSEAYKAYQEENPKDNYLYNQDTGEVTDYKKGHRRITRIEALIAAIAAIVAGGVTAGSVIGTYRLKFGGPQYPIEKNGRIRLKGQKDRLVNQFITHRHIPRESSDGGSQGGRSTIHTGAGGRSSSGGSRKF